MGCFAKRLVGRVLWLIGLPALVAGFSMAGLALFVRFVDVQAELDFSALRILFVRPATRESQSSELVSTGRRVCIGCLGGVMAIWANSEVPAVERVTRLQPFGSRLSWATLAFLDQVRFSIFPLGPGISHVAPHSVIVFYLFGSAFALLAGFVVVRNGVGEILKSIPALGAVWFLAALFPALGLVPIGDVWRAERFLYPALPGMILGVAFVAQKMSARVWLPLVIIFLVGFFIQSSSYLGKWKSPELLFSHSFEDEPGTNHVAAAKLGYFASRSGEDQKAIVWFETALKIEERNVDAMEGLAVMKAKNGDIAGGRELLEKAVALRPNRASLFFNLALCHFSEKDESEARALLKEALKRDATFVPALKLQKELDAQAR